MQPTGVWSEGHTHTAPKNVPKEQNCCIERCDDEQRRTGERHEQRTNRHEHHDQHGEHPAANSTEHTDGLRPARRSEQRLGRPDQIRQQQLPVQRHDQYNFRQRQPDHTLSLSNLHTAERLHHTAEPAISIPGLADDCTDQLNEPDRFGEDRQLKRHIDPTAGQHTAGAADPFHRQPIGNPNQLERHRWPTDGNQPAAEHHRSDHESPDHDDAHAGCLSVHADSTVF